MSSADLNPENDGNTQDVHLAGDSERNPGSIMQNISSNSKGAMDLERGETLLQQRSRIGFNGIALLSLKSMKAERLML
ncbi:MAG: hypothetical protein Q9161_009405 [Pseudevernia consocians]